MHLDTSPPHDDSLPRASFLALPLEIRLEIYSYLLYLTPNAPAHHQSYYSTRPPAAVSNSDEDSSSPSAIHASLLLTSRQVHREANPLLYARNTFVAHPTLLASFPRLRGWYPPVREASVLGLIRRFHVQVRLDCDYGYGPEDVRTAFSHVDELSVAVVQSTWLGAGCRNLRPFEAVRGVGTARVRGSTSGFDDYAAWLEGVMESREDEVVVGFAADEHHWAKALISGNL